MSTHSDPPRLAASLIVIRHTGAAPEILMARRAAHHRFMPNVFVFPGGAVDPADHHALAATPLRPVVRARLERSVTAGHAHALAIAAVRECHEEVGLSLGEPPALSKLEYLCRAVTPPDRTLRFDAYFFIVDGAELLGTASASHELLDPDWYTVERALALNLAAATAAVLAMLLKWLAHQHRDGLVPTLENRVWSLR